MSKIIIVSNRLPVTVKKNGGDIEYHKSIGGLATGLKGYHEQADSIWAGWPGIADEEIGAADRIAIRQELQDKYQSLPVYLSEQEIEQYYYGFCNKTIWPLFHYFPAKTIYSADSWEAYKNVNRKFFEAIDAVIGENDIIWVHDYQLMLLPQMIKEKYPNTQVGFFLHIPFPSFEIFRLLIWRKEILRGLLGADLIGFHTFDYVRHFLSSACRLLDLEQHLNKISYEDRYVQVDAFPMGIDYDRFSRDYDDLEFHKEAKAISDNAKDLKMILSIDRLDYTKGIPERLKAFSQFLARYPEYHEKVRLNLIVAPSRLEVSSYDELRKRIKELVSEINGRYGTVSWMPVWFFFQPFSQESLIVFYKHSDVLLVTPLRDGMNLVAKEYIAARTDYEGMVVISETAGAASELGEAVVVNANDYGAIAEGLKAALDMSREEKIAINKILHRRLRYYNVEFWAKEFLNALSRTVQDTTRAITQINIEKNSARIEQAYQKAGRRILFLDYDGTLVGFKSIPEQAKPDDELKNMLREIVKDPKNTVVIVSGRDRNILDDWLGNLNLHFIAAHGLWLRNPGREWFMTASLDNDWKEAIYHIMQVFSDRMPGALIEEKEYSLAFHYRQCEPDMVAIKLSELKEALNFMTSSMNLGIQEGNKVLEVKDNRVNKGYGATVLSQNQDYDFVMGAGDDYTDEDLFLALPGDAYTIKIGVGNTNARYQLKSWKSMRSLLEKFISISRQDS